MKMSKKKWKRLLKFQIAFKLDTLSLACFRGRCKVCLSFFRDGNCLVCLTRLADDFMVTKTRGVIRRDKLAIRLNLYLVWIRDRVVNFTLEVLGFWNHFYIFDTDNTTEPAIIFDQAFELDVAIGFTRDWLDKAHFAETAFIFPKVRWLLQGLL